MGATGMESLFFSRTIIAEIMEPPERGALKLRRALGACKMLSSGRLRRARTPAIRRLRAQDRLLGREALTLFNKYTGARGKSGSNDKSAEFVAEVRKVMDDAGVAFQTAELGRVDIGGGGTIACHPGQVRHGRHRQRRGRALDARSLGDHEQGRHSTRPARVTRRSQKNA